MSVCVCEGAYPACQQQSGAVGCSVVGEAHSDPIFRQLVRVGSAHDVVSFDLCVGDLQGSTREDSRVLKWVPRHPHLIEPRCQTLAQRPHLAKSAIRGGSQVFSSIITTNTSTPRMLCWCSSTPLTLTDYMIRNYFFFSTKDIMVR